MAREEQLSNKKDRRFLNLFIIMMPSLLLAMTASITSFYVRIGFQLALLLLQLVLTKSLIDTFVGED
jgi:hypothetical protein